MKIASYKDGSRDGQLVVVSRDLTLAHYATGAASRLQQVLDDWNFLAPQLEDLSQTLNHGKARHAFAFDPRLCLAPLPRSFYLAATEAGGAGSTAESPTMQIGRSDDLWGACDPARFAPSPAPASASLAAQAAAESSADAETGQHLLFAPQLAVITADLAAGCAADDAPAAIRLLMASLFWYRPMPSAISWGQPIGASFSPVAVTADELGAPWRDGPLGMTLQRVVSGKRLPVASDPDVRWPGPRQFGARLAECAALRGLRAGSIIGVGAAGGGRSVAGGDGVGVGGGDGGADGVYSARAGDLLRLVIGGTAGDGGDKLFGAIETPVACLD